MQGLIDAISRFFGNDYLATVIMSLIPLIELKGGIVFAWNKIGFIKAFLLAYVGSTIVFIGVFFLLKPLLNLLKKWKGFNGFATRVENYFISKAEKTQAEQEDKERKLKLSEIQMKQLGVFIFVAIPLPMTGVWTGTAIAVFLNLKFKEVILPIMAGNFVAGLLISLLAYICTLISIDLDIVLWVLFGLAVILLIVFIVKLCLSGKREK